MSFEITTAFVQQYGSSVEYLAQQKGSRLRNAVAMESGIVGKTAYFDQVGEVAAQRVLQRHGDSPLNPTPHDRRRVAMFDYDTGDLVDKMDEIKTLIDPTNSYTNAHGWAMGRGIDDEIIDAFFDTAYTGEDGSTPVTFPASQVVPSGGTGMTIDKLRDAQRILDEADVDPDEPRYIAYSAQQRQDLLETIEVTSSDYNTVKALVEGKIDTFMGFTFIRTQRLNVNDTNERRCAAWCRSGMKLGIGKDITARIVERSDKRFSMYVYFCMSIGATRMQEVKVVELPCVET